METIVQQIRSTVIIILPSSELMEVAELLRQTLHECILPYFRRLEAGQIGVKGPEDFVTIADTTAEKFLGERLTARLPGSFVVGEEGTAADPSLLDLLGEGECWIVDPVDGTLLFKNGQPGFGILLSRSCNGKTQAAWILETHMKDGTLDHRITMGDHATGVWHSAAAPADFWAVPRFSDRKRFEAKPPAIIHTHTFSPEFLRSDLADRMAAGKTSLAWTDKLYSAVSLYNAVILGDAAGYVSAYSAPWDHSCGAFLIRSLGGVARHLNDEEDYHPVRRGTGVISASSQAIYRLMMEDAVSTSEQRHGRDPDRRKSV